MDSILNSVKDGLGITSGYTHFDSQLIPLINMAFGVLAQLGVGAKGGFSISDASAVWSDFLPGGVLRSLVEGYVPKKVKLLFDPPQSSAVLDALKRDIEALEFRLNVEAESGSSD